MKEEMNKRKKEGWIEVWFAIEALAANKDVVEKAMDTHVKKLASVKDVLVYETKFSETRKIEKPMKNMEEGHSQIVEIRLFIKNMLTLVKVILLYGPSSIEIIGPPEMKIKIDEVQNISNTLATLVHQFASAGIGGIVITPEK